MKTEPEAAGPPELIVPETPGRCERCLAQIFHHHPRAMCDTLLELRKKPESLSRWPMLEVVR